MIQKTSLVMIKSLYLIRLFCPLFYETIVRPFNLKAFTARSIVLQDTLAFIALKTFRFNIVKARITALFMFNNRVNSEVIKKDYQKDFL
jgi:hypothetical protein